jgi:sugar lactone lactonase YvrE
MTDTLVPQARPDSSRSAAVGRLFVLELSGGRIHSMNPDGSDRKVIVTGCEMPDGIAVDVAAGHIYWTNMGTSPGVNDGSIERADLDGSNRKLVVARGATFTPKQLQLDKQNGKLYWCDREGMRVMRCNLDGTQIETASSSTPSAARYTGRKKVRTMVSSAASFAPVSISPRARAPTNAPTSKCSTTVCRSPLISSSIARTACSIGPIGVTHRAATP